jgi:hypothetical protein
VDEDATGIARIGQENPLTPHPAEGLRVLVLATLAAPGGTVKDTHFGISLKDAPYSGATSPSPLESDEGVGYAD